MSPLFKLSLVSFVMPYFILYLLKVLLLMPVCSSTSLSVDPAKNNLNANCRRLSSSRYLGFPPLYFPFALASAIPCCCVSRIYRRSSSAWYLYSSIIKLLSNRRRLSSVIPVNAGKFNT